ncbi:glycosyltransferase [bacterium]|nr:glycosyltransferase [bacterium]
MIEPDFNKCIYVKPLQGLGNRILLLDSVFAFATEFSFASIKICWYTSEGFSDESFEDLFDIDVLPKNVQLISLEEYKQAKKYCLNLENNFKQDPETLEWKFKLEPNKLLSTISNSSFCYESYAPLKWVFSLHLKNDGDFLSNFLKPSLYLKKVIDEVFEQGMDALHIRKGDAVIGPWAENYLVSPDEVFHKKVKESPKKRFFLSTDCEKTQQEFLELYPDQIIVNKQKDFVPDNLTIKDNKGCQDDAVVDMFLLSKANHIYGTNWSTFNKAANIIGQNNLTRLIDNNIPDFSAIVAVKNRFNILKTSIQSWLLQEKIKEIIVVDWSSEDFDKDYLEGLDPRIKVITVKGQENFHLSNAYNLAIKFASCDHIIKLDSDYIINPYHKLSEFINEDFDKEFLTGYWRQKNKDGDLGFLEYLNGFICVKKEYLLAVGGYLGNQFGYGNDDCDLYSRLGKSGLTRKGILVSKNFVPIFHIPHADEKRAENYQEKNIKLSLEKNKSVNYTE